MRAVVTERYHLSPSSAAMGTNEVARSNTWEEEWESLREVFKYGKILRGGKCKREDWIAVYDTVKGTESYTIFVFEDEKDED